MSKFLSRQAIDQAKDREPVPFPIPEWGGEVLLLPPTMFERETWESWVYAHKQKNDGQPPPHLRAALVVICLVDEEGKRLYADSEAAVLAVRSAAAVDRLFDEIQRISGMKGDAVGQAEKNSVTAQRSSSPMTSPSPSANGTLTACSA